MYTKFRFVYIHLKSFKYFSSDLVGSHFLTRFLNVAHLKRRDHTSKRVPGRPVVNNCFDYLQLLPPDQF